jgi:hypothetical protein
MGIALMRTGFSVGKRVHRCEGRLRSPALSVIRFELAERGEAVYK